MKILFEDCGPEPAEDRGLPNNSFLIEYKLDGISHYDIAAAAKQSEIFDHYYDKYKNVKALVQSKGIVNPKLWRDPKEAQAPKGKKKK